MPARWCRNWAMTCWPWGVCETSGWYWTPQILRAGDSSAATGAPSEVAVATKPSGSRAMPSKWLIHTVWLAGWSASRPAGVGRRGVVGDRQRGAPVLALAAPGHLAAELLGDELGAVADAEDGDAQVVDLGVEPRGALDVHRLGAAREDQRRRPALAHLGGGDRVGHDLGVDVRLADPPGDELGVLGAEVDDQAGGELVGQRWSAPVATTSPSSASASGLLPRRRARPSAGPSASRSRTAPSPAAARPVRLTTPDASWAGPCRICSSGPWVSTRTRSPRGSVGCTAGMLQCQPRPGASVAAANGVPVITASAPQATARAMSPPVVMPPSAMTWQ